MNKLGNADSYETPSSTMFSICVLDGVLEPTGFQAEARGSLLHERSRLEEIEVHRA